MRRLVLPVLVVIVLILFGCAGHSSRHTQRYHIQPCVSPPCGSEIIYNDMILNWELERLPSDEYILSGTIMPRGVSEGTRVELAVMSIELARDITIVDSFSFPIVTRDMQVPLRFKHSFKPNGGFDGLTFNWDIHLEK